MLFILESPKKQANWQPIYEQTYKRELDKLDVQYIVLDKRQPFTLNWLSSRDYLWVMHYEDLLMPEVKDTDAQVIFRMSGTATHPYCYQVNMEDEEYAINHVIDINLTFDPRMNEYVQSYFPTKVFIPTGYPIHVPEINVTRIPKRIVVGGRLSPDKQFMLTTYLLKDLLKDDYQVIFCYPNNKKKDDFWLEQYGGKARYERQGFQFMELDQAGWLNMVASAEFFFTASLGDTGCVSCVQACSVGTYPVVPKFRHGLPVYDTYVSQGYTPFCKSEVEQLIYTKPELTVDRTWFDPGLWAQRFAKILEGNHQ